MWLKLEIICFRKQNAWPESKSQETQVACAPFVQAKLTNIFASANVLWYISLIKFSSKGCSCNPGDILSKVWDGILNTWDRLIKHNWNSVISISAAGIIFNYPWYWVKEFKLLRSCCLGKPKALFPFCFKKNFSRMCTEAIYTLAINLWLLKWETIIFWRVRLMCSRSVLRLCLRESTKSNDC